MKSTSRKKASRFFYFKQKSIKKLLNKHFYKLALTLLTCALCINLRKKYGMFAQINTKKILKAFYFPVMIFVISNNYLLK
ncbi:hypothetical protein DLJ74_01670 [Gracilibacillus dipsosauri]|uniref:Uncharacterized protein n=1 Tax=Gracilibacillus dipsosauri TaxID=178340 RepID=A0A317L3G3_9BACI|nr:hypothetical protein DLJ74_01670 [Gracilibacillus dipsosauri]